MNFADPALAREIGLPVNRWGGNRAETYNWQVGASNSGNDWYFENLADCWDDDGAWCANGNAGRDWIRHVDGDAGMGTQTLLTLPLMGMVAKDAPLGHPLTCAFPRARHPDQVAFDPYDSGCGNGRRGGAWLDPEPTDAGTPSGPADAAAWVDEAKARGVHLYELGNESMLWSETHHALHPERTTYRVTRTRKRGVKRRRVACRSRAPAASCARAPWSRSPSAGKLAARRCNWRSDGDNHQGTAPPRTTAARLGIPSPPEERCPMLTADPQVAELVAAEERRQAEHLVLIPSENYASAAVRAANGSVLTDKYSEGYADRRYYEGNAIVDRIELLAVERARALFGVDYANVQPYSGSPANLAVYLAFAEPGDTVMGMALPAGGHLTHGHGVSATGRWFRAVHYGVRRDTGRIDLDEVRRLALRERPRIIFCGGTAIPRLIDFAGFAQIAGEVGAILAADIAHIAGLVAGGAHPTPVGHADVVTTTTHKTLRGPRGAMVMSTARHAEALERAVFPGLQGGPHDHTTAAIAIALREAAAPEFADYAHAIVANAQALADALVERGFELVSGGTDNHLILIDLTNKGVSGRPAAQALDRAGIVTNRNAIPFDPRKPMDPSGLRLGTPAITTRGMGPDEMRTIARWIDQGITADDATLARIRGEVLELTAAFPVPR